MIEKRKAKKIDKEISLLGFGGWQLGNVEFWGEMDFESGVSLVKEAVKKGVNFIDTAPGYGNGNSERIIGEAIKDCRDKIFVNTKFGHSDEGTNFSEEVMETKIRESAKRLQTDYIDSVILHNPPHYILAGRSNHLKEFNRLKEIGLINYFGVSIDTLQDLDLVLTNLDVDVIEIMFNIVHQEVSELFDKAMERGIMLVIKVPLDSGWLTGKYDGNSKFTGIRSRWNNEAILPRAEIVRDIKNIVNDEKLVKYALSFIASFDAVTTIIPGVKNSMQLASNIEAVSYKLDNKIRNDLIQLYNNKIKNMFTPW